jgi:hypothetical protein
MPNGGPRPDCVHCKHYRGRPIDEEGDPYCAYHAMTMPVAIYAFCSRFVVNEPNIELDWLDEELNRTQLREEIIYLWRGGYGVKFSYVPLVPISEYRNWSTETFRSELRRLADKHSRGDSSQDIEPSS